MLKSSSGVQLVLLTTIAGRWGCHVRIRSSSRPVTIEQQSGAAARSLLSWMAKSVQPSGLAAGFTPPDSESRPTGRLRTGLRALNSLSVSLIVAGRKIAAGLSWSTWMGPLTPHLWSSAFIACVTQRLASALTPKNCSYHFANLTNGCPGRKDKARSVYPKLCQSITKFVRRTKQSSLHTTKEGILGGAWSRRYRAGGQIQSMKKRASVI
mmetsp:Transcript_19409/g.23210  ORF Transcript_19409/g.23210 Transcript_19409/m.23210 type:complete len:210 (-) Transcript_19409:640-1269(-)